MPALPQKKNSNSPGKIPTPQVEWQFRAGAARELLSTRHLVVEITDFTDFHPILSVFSVIFEKIRALFYTQTPTGTTPGFMK